MVVDALLLSVATQLGGKGATMDTINLEKNISEPTASSPYQVENLDFDISVHQKAETIYARLGPSGVYDAANEGILPYDKWVYCQPCDTETPLFEGLCLVCGTSGGT